MYLADFIYDGKQLSDDFGCIICDFGGSRSEEEVSAAEIDFRQTTMHQGKWCPLSSTVYSECLSTEFGIMKDPCDGNDIETFTFTDEEIRALMRWLNRREFRKFQPIDEDGTAYSYYFYGSFNVEFKRIRGHIVGLMLTMTTNSPFGWAKFGPQTGVISAPGGSVVVTDPSDEIGFVYPDITLTSSAVDQASDYNSTTKLGTVKIWNEAFTEGSGYRETKIEMEQDTVSPETITIKGRPMTIATNHPAHSLANGFNYKFLRIGNTLSSATNTIKCNVPCTLVIEYEYPIKNII